MSPRLRSLLLIAAATCGGAALPLWAAVARRDVPPPGRFEITMTPESYRPADLTVQRGDTVVWRNTDIVVHTASSRSGAFDSGRIKAGEQFRWVPATAGVFPYICTKHRQMRGTLTVK
jgi:plastocyanin